VSSPPTAEKVVPASTDLNVETNGPVPVEQDKLAAGTSDSVNRSENPTYVSPIGYNRSAERQRSGAK